MAWLMIMVLIMRWRFDNGNYASFDGLVDDNGFNYVILYGGFMSSLVDDNRLNYFILYDGFVLWHNGFKYAVLYDGLVDDNGLNYAILYDGLVDDNAYCESFLRSRNLVGDNRIFFTRCSAGLKPGIISPGNIYMNAFCFPIKCINRESLGQKANEDVEALVEEAERIIKIPNVFSFPMLAQPEKHYHCWHKDKDKVKEHEFIIIVLKPIMVKFCS
ncbi:hypothetical protein CEXT_677561 [Caerostris extrusa]|uniref:Uncharacterized protein n=1 Tax=Caerostris extrusa TaxID=172846 RepID=A0AAV4V520_CAEEX|nr:hypothetical protein CEXT_677561 [Caerostris extrusa]